MQQQETEAHETDVDEIDAQERVDYCTQETDAEEIDADETGAQETDVDEIRCNNMRDRCNKKRQRHQRKMQKRVSLYTRCKERLTQE